MIPRRLRSLGWPAVAVAVLLNAASLRAQDQEQPATPPPATPTAPPAATPFQEGARAYSQRDFGRALRHWAPLAQRGDGAAQYNLGRMYARGEGVQRDLPEAYKWFTLATRAGRPEGEQARQVISRSMTTAQMAEGMRRAEDWRYRRR